MRQDCNMPAIATKAASEKPRRGVPNRAPAMTTRVAPAILSGSLYLLLLVLVPAWHVTALATGSHSYTELRRQLIREIEADVRETARYIDKRTLDERVMQVMGRVPRHEFVPDSVRDQAYQNRPLSIGHGQTISQPYIVALMTDLLDLDPGDRVLEIGTGSGYQAAVLEELDAEVYSIEIIEPLGLEAAERFRRLGYSDIHTRLGDGYYGWPEAAPFDAIIVTAASSYVPPPLTEQLKPGGRMLIPIGGRFQVQQLMLVEKTTTGELKTRQILPVRFVPLTGDH